MSSPFLGTEDTDRKRHTRTYSHVNHVTGVKKENK